VLNTIVGRGDREDQCEEKDQWGKVAIRCRREALTKTKGSEKQDAKNTYKLPCGTTSSTMRETGLVRTV